MPTAELTTGLLSGLAAVVVVLAVRASGRTGPDPTELGGVAVVVAALCAIAIVRPVPLAVVAGVAGVGAVSARSIARRGLPWSVALTVPFALLLAVDASSTGWIRAAVVVAASLGAAFVGRADESLGLPGMGLTLLAISAAGVFAAVPDTEEAAALLGACALVAVLGWPVGLARLGPSGGAAATALLTWVVAVGGRGRPPSIVGGLVCLGLLAAAPAACWLGRRPRVPGRGARPMAVLGAHGLAVLVASRGAGIRHELPTAVALALVSTAIAIAGAVHTTDGPGNESRSRR